ncbi:hypothetical protein AC578_2748 [Pseudocercospora eumusae]|uniref:F-box domain-containing protein n=1 Tax=Pseudocercospora eumusae TaxID=321146 RepID=A0A139HGS8_9PEZI|nr:hypothetical protein AC578_2748 [Pseudocercospora eumusae]
MATAAHAVFDTAELLEAIILELPVLDMLVYQRVSKNWRDGVQNSIVIKRALFLAPEDAKGHELKADGVTLKNVRNPYPVYKRSGARTVFPGKSRFRVKI